MTVSELRRSGPIVALLLAIAARASADTIVFADDFDGRDLRHWASASGTPAPAAGDLVFTEIMASPIGTQSSREWFEIQNTSGTLLDLANCTITRSDVPAETFTIHGRLVGTGQYLAFARSADSSVTGGVVADYVYGGISLVASNSGLTLTCGATAIDSVSWSSSTSGQSLQLDPAHVDAAENDDPAFWCTNATTTYGEGGTGTPGSLDLHCSASNDLCTDPVTHAERAVVTPSPGDVVISEWMPDPTLVSDSAGEWFEVRARAPVDLNGLQAGTTSLGASPIVPLTGECLRIAPGAREWALFGRDSSAANNGSLPPVDATFGFGLANTSGTLAIGVGDATLDTKTWSGTSAGRSIMIDTDGTQCTAPAGATAYNGTDVGTPAALNTPPECP